MHFDPTNAAVAGSAFVLVILFALAAFFDYRVRQKLQSSQARAGHIEVNRPSEDSTVDLVEINRRNQRRRQLL